MEKDTALCKYQQLICNKINVFGFLLLTKLYYSLFTSILLAVSICKNVSVAQMHCKDEHKLFKSLIAIYMNRTLILIRQQSPTMQEAAQTKPKLLQV